MPYGGFGHRRADVELNYQNDVISGLKNPDRLASAALVELDSRVQLAVFFRLGFFLHQRHGLHGREVGFGFGQTQRGDEQERIAFLMQGDLAIGSVLDVNA